MTIVCGLLLPGMTLNSTIFPDFPFPTISVDFNAAPPPSSGKRDLMAHYVDELERQLETFNEWQCAEHRIVIAHSFGGMLAQQWLSQNGAAAAKVARLLLIGTTAGPMYDAVRIKLARIGRHEVRLPINQLMHFWNSSLVTKATKRIMTGGTVQVRTVDFRTIPRPTDVRIDFAGWRNTDWRAMRAYRSAMKGFDVRKLLSNITMPTIVMHGSDDALFPPSVAEALTSNLPNAELRLVAGAHHVLPLTHGGLVREAAENLLDERWETGDGR